MTSTPQRSTIGGFARRYRTVGQVVSAATILVGLAAAPASADSITSGFVITSNVSAASMVAELIGANPGLTVVAGSEVYVGAAIAAGTFTGGTGIIPFDAGVALTTGAAALTPMPVDPIHNPKRCPNAGIPGPNNCSSSGLNDGTPGNAALAAVAGTTVDNTYDAATLSFSFIPTADTITFQYVFGSEEYKEFVGSSFNDVFGFFLNGSLASDNIALLPGTTTPVSINNVNQNLNSQYFTFGGLNIQYDGLVGVKTTLFVTAPVNVGVVNTIMFGVADVSDQYFDSGVLLSASSFVAVDSGTGSPAGSDPAAVPEPGTLLLLGTGIFGVVVSARKKARSV